MWPVPGLPGKRAHRGTQDTRTDQSTRVGGDPRVICGPCPGPCAGRLHLNETERGVSFSDGSWESEPQKVVRLGVLPVRSLLTTEDTLWAASGGQVSVVGAETHAVEVSGGGCAPADGAGTGWIAIRGWRPASLLAGRRRPLPELRAGPSSLP